MICVAQRFIGFLLSATTLLILGACAPQPLPKADVDLGGVRSVALQPVVFRGTQPDVFCPSDIGWELRAYLKFRLQEKGFDVRVVPDRSRPYGEANPLASEDPGEIVEHAPPGVDAVAILWVDQLDELGFCDNERYRHLYLAGKFALISTREGKIIWQTGASAGGIPLGDPARSAAVEMARKTAGRLPKVEN